jgi:hypothetical protein
LVLSPTGLINLGFTTEGRLAAMLIITFSWGFQLGGYLHYSYINTTPPQVTNVPPLTCIDSSLKEGIGSEKTKKLHKGQSCA